MARKGIQLAYPFEERRFHKWGNRAFIQPKLDGDRMRAIFDEFGRVTLVSSEENERIFFPLIVTALEDLELRSIELDGEAYIHGLPHEEIHSIVSRSVNQHPDANKMRFHVFDLIHEQIPQFTRITALNQVMLQNKSAYIVPVETHLIDSVNDVYRWQEKFLDEEYEGFILRHPNAYYLRRRSTFMMKFKPKKKDCYKILGYEEEIDKYGHPKGTLGAFKCEANDGSGTTFSVGTGFSADQRREYWLARDTLVGLWAHVKYQNITATGRVPRHPVFIEISDKGMEDLDVYEVE
jgi:DNA ligase-1